MSLDGTVETLTKEEVVRDYEQKAIKLLLPLEIEGVVNEYTFTFRILRVTAVDVRSGAGGGKT
jgi:hypothetical protein